MKDESASHGRPNILLITTDQQTHDALSCAGNPWLHTPHLDALAASGTRCTHAFVPFPVCVPSRTALQYGCAPHQVMQADHELIGCPRTGPLGGVRTGFRERELGHVLANAGYRCGWAGKWHVGTWGPTESLGDYADTSFEALCPIDDGRVPEACATFMDQDDERPFCCVASFDNPHNIHEWAIDSSLPWGPLGEPPTRSGLPPLPINHGSDSQEPRAMRDYREHRDLRFDADAWRRYRWAYYRLIERVDAQIGSVLAALDASGARERTLILFTSDHGESAGSHDLAFKHVLCDESVRVPLIISGPGIAADATSDCLVATGLDIHATLCAAADTTAPTCGIDERTLGRDLRSMIAGEHQRERVIVSTRFPNRIRARLVRERRWAYMAYEKGPVSEQLFDCDADPGQRVNLAGCAPVADQQHRLREHLRSWQHATADTFNAGHYCHPDTTVVLPGDDYLC